MKRALSKKNIWDSIPSSVKERLGPVVRIFPVERFLGKEFRQNWAFVSGAQWWSADQARAYQLERVRHIVTLAYERSHFYKRIYDSISFCPGDLKCLSDVEKLPTIDKSTVVDNLSEMSTRSTDGRDVDYVATGGTSGRPLRFYIDVSRSATEYAYLTCSWLRAGYRLGMPMAVLRGRVVKRDIKGLCHEYDPILRHHYYSNFHMTEANMEKYLNHIAHLGPCTLHAYPSSAFVLAKYLQATNRISLQNVSSVLLESENVYEDQIDVIESAFGSRSFSSYGHSEKCVLAAQCEYSRDYHVWPTYGYFELLDEYGQPVTEPGKRGEIVGTGFMNTVMPFIRYRTGDWATYAGDRCEACGREHILIKDIEGRWPQGGLTARDGSTISMTALNVHDDTFENVRDYQFHQSVPGEATLAIIPSKALSGSELQHIATSINRRLQGQVSVDIEIRNELVKTARGKQLRVVKK